MASSIIDTQDLRNSVAGTVIGPDDHAYDEARTLFYGGHERRPAAIVRVANTDDVRRVVMLARETGRELAVRSGGHSIAGHSVSAGGLVLDLKDMDAIDIDVEGQTAWAETGTTTVAYTAATNAYGLATGFGDQGSVGIGGITLGGGVGFLSRKHGLTIDSLLAAEIVTADGELLRVDGVSHPELFWAIRGGGGNFGVATRFQYRLHPVDTVVGGMLFLPGREEVIEGFMAEAARAPEELSTIANVMTAPPMPFFPEEVHGTLILMGFLVYAGDVAEGERAVAPFKALAEPLMDMVRHIPYPEMYPLEEAEYHPIAAVHTGFMDGFGPAESKLIVDRVQEPGAMMRAVQLRELGAAVSRVSDDATAYAHRSRKIMANVASMYETEERHDANQAWVDEVAGSLHGEDTTGYVNFMADEGQERVRQAYPGDTWDRLRKVKATYDPTNLFHLNQNIPPA